MTKRKLIRTGPLAVATLIAFSNVVGAAQVGRAAKHDVGAGGPEVAQQAASQGLVDNDRFGIGVTPSIYFVNFLLAYIVNPNRAANFPAYRVAVPPKVADCLDINPTGCSYEEYSRFFDDTLPNENCSFPPVCQTLSGFENLAPPLATNASQINEPLGLARAEEIAQALGVDKSMILTDREYQCTIAIKNKADLTGQLINACFDALTASRAASNIPLSSYGLALADPEATPADHPADTVEGDVQSLCAPAAPCLVFNELFGPGGDLIKRAQACGWEDKFVRMQAATDWFKFLITANKCQTEQGGSLKGRACLTETVCR